MKINIVHHSQVTILDDYRGHLYLKNDLLNFLENHHDVQNRRTNVKATMTDWTMNKYSPILDLSSFVGSLPKFSMKCVETLAL